MKAAFLLVTLVLLSCRAHAYLGVRELKPNDGSPFALDIRSERLADGHIRFTVIISESSMEFLGQVATSLDYIKITTYSPEESAKLLGHPAGMREMHGIRPVPSEPFWDLTLADADAKTSLRSRSDAPAFAFCETMAVGAFVKATGEFTHNGSFGLDAKRWTCQELVEEEREALLAGLPELRARQSADHAFIEESTQARQEDKIKCVFTISDKELDDPNTFFAFGWGSDSEIISSGIVFYARLKNFVKP